MYQKCGYPYHKEYYSKCDYQKPEYHTCHPSQDCDNDMSYCSPKVEKECVKTIHCCFKLYKVCQYKMYKVCSSCKHEFEYEKCRGMCPKCGGHM